MVIEFDETLLLKAFMGKCSPQEESQINDWLEESEKNRKHYAHLKMLWHARKMRSYSSSDFLKEINSKIDRVERQSRRLVISTLMKYAAILIVVLAVGIAFIIGYGDKPVMITRYVPSDGKVVVLELADGSRVWLNSGSEFSYTERFSKKDRRVSLKGEAFFEVRKDVSKPFIVNADGLTVKVTGTSFNLNTTVSGNIIQTVLVSGSVALLDSSGAVLTMLKAGQMATSDKVTGRTTVMEVNTRDYTSWQEGLVAFEKAKLNEILTRIEQVYKVELVYDSVKFSKLKGRYNFVFRKNQDIDTVLDMLKYVAPPAKMVKVKGLK